MIIGITGKAGSGKDTVADLLVKDFSFVKLALADELKRICMRVFDFSIDQLWGPSEKRNEPDKRYVQVRKGSHGSTASGKNWTDRVPLPAQDICLTPRHALQQLGTDWGRACYENVWVDFAMRVAEKLESRIHIGDRLHDPQGYIQHEGLVPLNEYPDLNNDINGVVVPDCRFKNEFDAIRAKGGKLLRIKRTAAARFVAGADGVQEKMSHEKWELQGNAALHRSETEQDEVPDEYFDFVINNDGDLAELRLQVSHVMKTLKGEIEGEARADDFASALTNMSKDADAILISRKMEDIPGVLESEDVEIKFEPTGALKDMLKRREEDIKSGRLMEYDADQADVPPFMRKRKK